MKYRFLAFGGRNSQKRVDVIIRAAQLIENHDFEVWITKGVDTEDVLRRYSPHTDDVNKKIVLVEQQEDVSSLYNSVNCFISSSSHETFSYAIAEATFAEIPVIQSDIEGTWWNASNPSTFLFESLNAEILAEKMKEVMSIPADELRKRCEVTRKNNINKYSLGNWCGRIIKQFQLLEPDLTNKRCIIVCQYAAPYEGNFIGSLKRLADKLVAQQCIVSYIFPLSVREQVWYPSFASSNKCYTTRVNASQSTNDLMDIFKEVRPDIIYSHLDGYDVPIVKASTLLHIKPRIIWHLHDHLSYVAHPIKALWQRYCYYNHYLRYAVKGNVKMISVSAELRDFILKINPHANIDVIPNGIDENRIKIHNS